MGKYTNYTHKDTPKKSGQLHEIWRGLGCLMMVLIPAISIAAGSATVDFVAGSNPRLIPRQFMGTPRLPDWVYRSDGLTTILTPLTEIKDLYAIALASILYMILLSGLISVIYAAVYAAVGPSRYGPTDAPPPKTKVTKKSR